MHSVSGSGSRVNNQGQDPIVDDAVEMGGSILSAALMQNRFLKLTR